MRKKIIGVMGPGELATIEDKKKAYELGKLIAQQGWVLLSGGRREGVMDAVNQGAASAGGLTLGIIAGDDLDGVSDAVSIPIITGMGSARNNINVLSSDLVVACGMGTGTASEVALALKAGKTVILLSSNRLAVDFFQDLATKDRVRVAQDAEEAVAICKSLLIG